jgi:hypothetical protein
MIDALALAVMEAGIPPRDVDLRRAVLLSSTSTDDLAGGGGA